MTQTGPQQAGGQFPPPAALQVELVSLDLAGPRLRAWRKRLGWTQTQLARRAGVSSDTVRRLEGGGCRRPMVGTLVRIAAALGCNLIDLIAAQPD